MARLNIQLSRHGHTTTRRPRWVVWILGFSAIFFAILQFGRLWFTRSELLVASPIDTQIAIELNAYPRYLPELQSLLNKTPLISNRGLLFADILPNIRGKFAIFVMSDGTTAVALKTTKATLPTELLDAERIVVQTVTPNIVLLSEKLLPRSPLKTRRTISEWIPDMLGRRIGFVSLPNQPISRPIHLSTSTLTLGFPNMAFEGIKHPLPANTEAFLSTQMLPNQEFATLLTSAVNANLLRDVFREQTWVFLTKHEQTKGILLWSEKPAGINREELMKQLSANLNPTIQEKQLQDGDIIQEMLIHPDLGSIEEVTVQGKLFFHSKSEQGEEYFLSKDGELLFSNNEQDLRSFLEGSGGKSQQFCDSTLMGSTTKRLLDEETDVLNHETPSLFRSLLENYSSLGVKSQGNTVLFTLCR